MLSHAETGPSARLLRSCDASGHCRGLLQVLLENRTAATAGTSPKDAEVSPDPTTRQSFLRLVHFHGRHSPLSGRHHRRHDGILPTGPDQKSVLTERQWLRPLGISMRPSYCTLFNSGSNGDTRRVGTSAVCDPSRRRSDFLFCAVTRPLSILTPVSFANLFDVERIGGRRRAGAEAAARQGLPPLESAAFSRRTPHPDILKASIAASSAAYSPRVSATKFGPPRRSSLCPSPGGVSLRRLRRL